MLCQVAALDQLHREVRPAVHLAGVVDLHDVGVMQRGNRLRLAQESFPLRRQGIGAGQQHFQGDGSLQPQMPGPVDDAHAAVAEHGLHPVAGNLWQVRGKRCGLDRFRILACARRWKQRRVFRVDAAESRPPLTDLRKQLRAVAAHFFRGSTRVEHLLQ